VAAIGQRLCVDGVRRNINQPWTLGEDHTVRPFPEAMIDSASSTISRLLQAGNSEMRPEFFTNQYGLIVDYLAEWMREMRKRNFGDAITSTSGWPRLTNGTRLP